MGTRYAIISKESFYASSCCSEAAAEERDLRFGGADRSSIISGGCDTGDALRKAAPQRLGEIGFDGRAFRDIRSGQRSETGG